MKARRRRRKCAFLVPATISKKKGRSKGRVLLALAVLLLLQTV